MKKALSLSALALAVLVGCNATNQANTSSNNPNLYAESLVVSPNDNREYKTLKLSNEIEVVLVSDPSVDKSAAALSVGVGLLHDPMTQQGMAHYLEHMLFLGTERFPDTNEYSEFMTKNGGAHNAYTWLDITNYMFKANNDAFEEGLDRFSDFFKSPKLYPEYTDKEKNAVNAEWSMRRELDFFGQFKLARKMMGEHPANRFLIGNLETLGDKEGSKLHTETVAFFDKYYSSNIMKVALLSNKPLAEMEALANKYFSDIKNKNIEKPSVTAKVDLTKVGGKKVFYKPNKDVKQLTLDFTIENNSDQFALKPNRFLSYLIYSEMPGTPATLLREKGWISDLGANASPSHYGNYGTFSIDVTLTDSGMEHRDEIVAIIMQYIDLIREKGVDKKYFDEIRTSLNNQFKFLEKGDEFGYVSNLAGAMQVYPTNHVINAPYYYGQFDEKAIEQVLDQLTPETLKIWYVSQKEETDSTLHFYDGNYRIADISQDEINSWKAPTNVAMNLPAVNRLLPESFDLKATSDEIKEKPQLVHDTKHIKVWQFASKNFSHQPKGMLKVYINNPATLTDMDTAILLSVWQDLYSKNVVALNTEAGVGGMSMSLSDSNGVVFTVNGFTDKQSELIVAGMNELRVAPTELEFNQAKDRFLRAVANKSKNFPYSQAFNAFYKVTSQGSYEDAALIERAKSLSISDLNKVMEQVLNNNQVRVFMFGNYDQNDVKTVVSSLEKALPNEVTTTQYARAKAWLPKAGQVFSVQRDIDVADVALVDMHMHPVKGKKQEAQGLVLQGHFSNKVFDKLRTEEQLAYAVGGFSTTLDDYVGFGMYIQTPVKGPGEMQARFDEYKLEYKKELDSISEETFAQLKNAVLIKLNEQPKNLGDELRPYLSDWYEENFDFNSKAELIKEVEQVTLADVKDFYAKTVLNKDAARLNVQMRGTKFADKAFGKIENQTIISDFTNAGKVLDYQK